MTEPYDDGPAGPVLDLGLDFDVEADPDLVALQPDDSAEFLYDMAPTIVQAYVRDLRAFGIRDPDELCDTVLDVVLDHSTPFGTPGVDEFRRETFAAICQRAVDDAIANPPEDLEEASRRLPRWREGTRIVLADGQAWSFPRLSLRRRTMLVGDRPVKRYRWATLEGPGSALFVALVCLDYSLPCPALPDPWPMMTHLRQVGELLLQRNYRLTSAECRRLMPIDLADPACAGELVALARVDTDDPVQAGEPMLETLLSIARQLLEHVAPVIRSMRRTRRRGA